MTDKQEKNEVIKEIKGENANLVYHIHNTESWAAATKEFFKQFFGVSALLIWVLFLGHAFSCIDAPKVVKETIEAF